jgi:hypothetical protein
MPRFPADAPRERVLRAFEALGLRLVREGSHLALQRDNEDGSRTPMTLPNHRTLKGSTLRTVLTQSGVARDDCLAAYDDA